MGEKSRPITQYILPIFATVAAAVIAGLSCGTLIADDLFFNHPIFSRACFDGDRSRLERFAHFTYPASASDFHEDCDMVQGANIRIWFAMDASDLDTFVASTLVKSPVTQAKLLPEFGPRVNQNALLYGEYQGGPANNYSGQYIWVDTSNPGRYIVLLRYAEI